MKLTSCLAALAILCTAVGGVIAQQEQDAQEAEAQDDAQAQDEAQPQDEAPAQEQPPAQDAAAADIATAESVEMTTVVSDLVNPSGIAVQPETGHIFVSDSGALRVIKFDPADPSQVTEVITGFPQDVYGKGPMYNIGPLGLHFLSKNTLVVGGGGLVDGQELLRVYELPEDGSAIPADQMKTSLGPIEAGEQSQSGEGNFYDLAATENAVFVTSNGDDTKGWVLRATITDGSLSDLQTFIATKEKTSVDAPVGIAINPTGPHVVVGQMGEITVPQDSLLTFYHPESGEMLLNLETGLFDITALKYAPSGRLYTTDFAWMDTSQGGLFRLEKSAAEDGTQGVQAVRIATLEKPAAMVFGNDGALYVTVFNEAPEPASKTGAVVKFTGNF